MKTLFTIHFASIDGSKNEQKYVVAENILQAYSSVPDACELDCVGITKGPSVEVL